jgi:hypothetical protein
MTEYNAEQFQEELNDFHELIDAVLTYEWKDAPFEHTPCFSGWERTQHLSDGYSLPYEGDLEWAIENFSWDIPDCVWNVLAWAVEFEFSKPAVGYRHIAIRHKPEYFATLFSDKENALWHHTIAKTKAEYRKPFYNTEDVYLLLTMAKWCEPDEFEPLFDTCKRLATTLDLDSWPIDYVDNAVIHLIERCNSRERKARVLTEYIPLLPVDSKQMSRESKVKFALVNANSLDKELYFWDVLLEDKSSYIRGEALRYKLRYLSRQEREGEQTDDNA